MIMKKNLITQFLARIAVEGIMWTVIIILIYHLSGCS
jgi:hypothetical protein